MLAFRGATVTRAYCQRFEMGTLQIGTEEEIFWVRSFLGHGIVITRRAISGKSDSKVSPRETVLARLLGLALYVGKAKLRRQDAALCKSTSEPSPGMELAWALILASERSSASKLR